MNKDSLIIAKKKFNSRLIIGTGKYKNMSECAKAIELSGAEIVTVAVRRVNISDKKKPLLMDYIDPKKITDMKLGMPVSVKLDAMPFQEFGGLDGELIYISNDTFNESLSGDKGVFYRGRVKVRDVRQSKMPKDFVLSQGMMASADIMVGKRPLISYFTYPIMKAFEESFNEPE